MKGPAELKETQCLGNVRIEIIQIAKVLMYL